MKPTIINLIIFGIEKTGSELIHQISKQPQSSVSIRIPMITNDTVVFYENDKKPYSWNADFSNNSSQFTVDEVIESAYQLGLQNVIVVDTTNSKELTPKYKQFLEHQFDVISVNDDAIQFPFKYKIKPAFLQQESSLEFVAQQSIDKTVQELLERISAISQS
jgi:homoserine dehydrogenase